MYTQAYNHNNLIIKLFDSILFLSRYVNVLLNLFLVYMVFITTYNIVNNVTHHSFIITYLWQKNFKGYR